MILEGRGGEKDEVTVRWLRWLGEAECRADDVESVDFRCNGCGGTRGHCVCRLCLQAFNSTWESNGMQASYYDEQVV